MEVFFDHSVVVFGSSGVCRLGFELIEHVICENQRFLSGNGHQE